jgi:hypothetical protein
MANILGHGYVTIKDEDEQKPLRELYVKNGGSWATVQAAYIKSGPSWIRVFPTPNAVVNFSTLNLNFSTYTTFNSTVETVTISNTGDEVLTITSITESTSDKFTTIGNYSGLGTQLPYTINPGASKTFTVQISGQLVGTATGTVTFVINKGALGNQTVTVNLDCETLALFSKAQRNTNSLSIRYDQNGPDTFADFSISNLGNGVLTISSFNSLAGYLNITNAPIGNVTSPGLTLTIPPGGSRSYRANLTAPVKTTYGALTDTLSIISDSVDGTITIPVSLTIVPHGTVTLTTNASTWQVPFGLNNNVEIEIQAARGGNGGNDSAPGGAGGDGGFYKITSTLTFGQTLQFYPGGAGSAGSSGGGAPGGVGGTNALGYGNGGPGSAAGPVPWSGGGGSGAAATIARIVTESTVNATIFAGGGGGGGGGGNRSIGLPGNTGIGRGGELRAVSLDGRWSSFMNNNAVWPWNAGLNASFTFYRKFTATYTGIHYFKFSADNATTIRINSANTSSELVGSTGSFTSTSVVAKNLIAGDYEIRVDVSDWGVAAGVALIITNSSDTTTLFNLRNVLTTNNPFPQVHNGEPGEPKGGDGGGAGGGGGGLVSGSRGAVRGGDSGAYGGYRGTNGVSGGLVFDVLEDKTRAGTPYVKITY